MTPPRRVVLMRIATDDDAAQVRKAHVSFEAIPGVRCAVAVQRTTARVGTPGFTHLSIFEFQDAGARAAYHEHPLHTGAREHVRARTTDLVVVDLE